MGKFIEEFYYGNLDPQARSTKQNKAVQKQMEVYCCWCHISKRYVVLRYCSKYELKELTQKDGYYKNEEVISVEITEHEKTLTFEVTNKKIPPKPDKPTSPQTGDNSNIALWFTIMCLSLLAMIGLGVYNRKVKNN